jgi:phosphocarrier protein
MMIEARITIVNQLGLHARAAAKFVSVATTFSCQVYIDRDSQKVDGKNMMNVMLLAAGKGTEVTLTTDGQDEIDAMLALTNLVESGFGEIS